MAHPVRAKLKRGDAPQPVEPPQRPLVFYTVTLQYGQRPLMHKSVARDWIGALRLALHDRQRDPNYDADDIPTIKIEQK